MGSLFGRMSKEVPAEHFVLKGNRQLPPFPEDTKKVVFAAGCFWGTEKRFWRMPGVYATSVGYIGGKADNPSYEAVCSGTSGHTEGCQVVYHPDKIALSDLLRMFWECHNPTQGNRQGNDTGSQYRSGFYADTPDQLLLAQASKEAYQAVLGKKITTEFGEPGKQKFFHAEGYHQQYLAKPGARPYCSAQPCSVGLPPWDQWNPDDVPDSEAPKLPESFWEKHAPRKEAILHVSNDPISHL